MPDQVGGGGGCHHFYVLSLHNLVVKCSEQMIRPWPSHDRNKKSGITLPFKDCLQIISVK